MQKNKSKKGRPKAARTKGKRRIFLWGLLVIALLACGGRWLLSDQLETTFYHVYSPKVTEGENIRVVVLSDLHNGEFGPGNADLLEQIRALGTDVIAVAGDMVNSDEDNLDIILTLCKGLVEIAPVYYSPGNHESNLMYEKGSPIESLLLELGVHVLVNRAEEVTIHRAPLLIGGLTTSTEGYEEYGAQFFDEYEKSGMYHGDTGLFPRYSGGMYSLPHSTLFVSRGMGGHSRLPRVNNRPELAVIDINGRQDTQ